MRFPRTDTILSVNDYPDSAEPFVETKRAILKDRPNLDGELFILTVLAFPEAAGLSEPNFLATTSRASHAIGPAQAYHEVEASVRVGEVFDCFL